MTNLSITGICNLDCRYCFARDVVKPDPPQHRHVTLESFRRMLDFLQRSGMGEARLLGGEPTLHPQFSELMDEVSGRGLRAIVFSNGLMPARALRKLEQMEPECVAVLVNAIPPGRGAQRLGARQMTTLRRLGARATLGMNIDTAAPSLEFLLVWIQELALAKRIRLGLAHPALNGTNRFLHPRYYPMVGKRVVEFAKQAGAVGVHLQFDCGFVPCMFPPGSLAVLGVGAADLGRQCNPIPDVLPDEKTVSCFPLAALHWERLANHEDAGKLRAYFARVIHPYRSLGLFPACADCSYRVVGECTGGCLAGALRRLRSGAGRFYRDDARAWANETSSLARRGLGAMPDSTQVKW